MSKLQFEIAMQHAKGAIFSTRAGDIDQDFNLEGAGARIVVQDFGNYNPFILNDNTKDWLKRAYKLTENEATQVYRYLVSCAREDILERRRMMTRQNQRSSFSHPYIEWLKGQTRH